MEIKRKLKSLENKTGEVIKKELREIISYHERYKNCYFWTPNTNATGRRRMEFANVLTFELNGIKYKIEQELNLSCKNFYYGLDIYKNDKKSNVTSLTKLLEEKKKVMEL